MSDSGAVLGPDGKLYTQAPDGGWVSASSGSSTPPTPTAQGRPDQWNPAQGDASARADEFVRQRNQAVPAAPAPPAADAPLPPYQPPEPVPPPTPYQAPEPAPPPPAPLPPLAVPAREAVPTQTAPIVRPTLPPLPVNVPQPPAPVVPVARDAYGREQGARQPTPEVLARNLQDTIKTGNPDNTYRLLRETYPGMKNMDAWRSIELDIIAPLIARGEADKADKISDAIARVAYTGMNDHLQNAYSALAARDVQGAANELSSSYNNFFPDGAVGQFLSTPDGRLFGRRVNATTGEPLGAAFQITPEDILRQMKFTRNPVTFMKTLTDMQKTVADTTETQNKQATTLATNQNTQINENYRTQLTQAETNRRQNQSQGVEIDKSMLTQEGLRDRQNVEQSNLNARHQQDVARHTQEHNSRMADARLTRGMTAEEKAAHERGLNARFEYERKQMAEQHKATLDETKRNHELERRRHEADRISREKVAKDTQDAAMQRTALNADNQLLIHGMTDEKERKETVTSVQNAIHKVLPAPTTFGTGANPEGDAQYTEALGRATNIATHMLLKSGKDAVVVDEAVRYALGLVRPLDPKNPQFKLRPTSTGLFGVEDTHDQRPNKPPLAILDPGFVRTFLPPQVPTPTPAPAPGGARAAPAPRAQAVPVAPAAPPAPAGSQVGALVTGRPAAPGAPIFPWNRSRAVPVDPFTGGR